ncbi:hypothetical protein IHE45_10G016900 [Dioscorea alata]|uniref:Uncharacterized protein n=1 Tax=Dioscorea alata TaxID=55571 RepID=A0ACB7V9U7_DIOAL|nr:hypothetical protein IHE45_10G016900 [Dioscorea alata]
MLLLMVKRMLGRLAKEKRRETMEPNNSSQTNISREG